MALLGVALLALASSACTESRQRAPADGGRDAPADGGSDRGPSCSDAGASKAMGQACGCNSDCQSNFCVDGVCCSSACQDKCKACNVPATVGTCSFVPTGLKPRSPTTCVASDVASCGQDGTCDGQGGCRKYPLGTTCKGGQCDGDAVSGINVCDGAGRCRPGATKICAPFSCNAAKNDCYPACTKNTDCVSGVECVKGSCGPKMKGAVCSKNDECASGFCSDGVCCSVACMGGCVSCNLVGHEGTCWPVDPGNPDPRLVCKDSGAASCGETGTCDGFGACAKYAAETVCIPPVCTGDKLATPGTCDGDGTCRQPGAQDCPPFRCVNGACNTQCTSDSDCVTGIACRNGSCGPKQDGQICKAAGECASGNCVDGVCCADACEGTCRSCALPSSLGKCTPIPAGNAPGRGSCADQGAASCGTDGKCDGAGACRKYRPGTVCAEERCASNVYTGPSTCSATGQCTAPGSRPCAPFACNGQRCFDACTNNGNCIPPNVCNGNSCGKKVNGANCSNNNECASAQCWQGVCCGTTCRLPCKSCALPGSEGNCAFVPTGAADPSNTCVDQGAASCGTNGRCAAGACQRYAAGTSCRNPTCPSGTTMFTGRSTCDGAGSCNTPGTTSCFPFRCGTNACRSACSADGDCAAGAVCTRGSCGLKPKGSPCGQTSECMAGLVCSAKNVCCDRLCDGPCVSCTLAASPGTCSPVPADRDDPNGKCGVSAATTCGNDGKCDGAGGCRKHEEGTQCAAPTCSGMFAVTNPSTCNGTGSCVPGGTRDCGLYACSDGACKTACASSSDCKSPTVCEGGKCGTKTPLGDSCSADSDCLPGNFCTDGVCCTVQTMCPTCQRCNVDRSGTCRNVSDAIEPHNRCAPSPPCGNTGGCRAGSCAKASDTTTCGSASCSGSTVTPVGRCNGTGTCNQPSQPCPTGYVCGPTQCRTTCTAATDCATGFRCTGSPTNAGSCVPKKGPGEICAAGSECLMGNCVNDRCCLTASCGKCQTCTGAGGTCANVAAGTVDPTGMCVNATCGNKNTCTAAGQCQTHEGESCAMAMCGGAAGMTHSSAGVCNGMGTCATASTNCNDNNACTTDSCDPQTGCAHAPVGCNDSNACTTDSCNARTGCVNTTMSCNDNNACTTDSCDPQTGCANTTRNCDDDNPCTTDSCNAQTGCVHTVLGCDDDNACTADSCDARTGACAHRPVGCDDSNACTTDSCDPQTGCANRARDCDDDNACTRDSCNTSTGCVNATIGCAPPDQCQQPGICSPNTGACSYPDRADGTICDADGSLCTVEDSCKGGSCEPGSARVCDNGQMCVPTTGICIDIMSIAP